MHTSKLVKIFFCGYLLAIMAVTLLPGHFNFEFVGGADTFRYNIIPFHGEMRTIFASSYDIFSFIGNALMLAPMGILVPILFGKLNAWKSIFFMGLGIALFIEMMQLVLCVVVSPGYRYPDVDDVILNTLSALIGYWVYRRVKLMN